MTAKEDKEKEKTRRENLSKFIYQLANTCFTAMVVVAAVGLVLGVDDAKPYALLLGVGLFSTIFLALFADNILKKEIIMEGMYIVLGGVGIVACCLYLWSAFTKSGKKWIESL